MDLQAAFRARLKAVAALNTPTGGRIEWGQVPQGAPLPYLVLTKATPGRDWTHDGPNALVRPRIQIDIYADGNAKAATLASALQAEMERLDDVIAGGWKFSAPAFLVTDRWPGPEEQPGGQVVFRIGQDYELWARPA